MSITEQIDRSGIAFRSNEMFLSTQDLRHSVVFNGTVGCISEVLSASLAAEVAIFREHLFEECVGLYVIDFPIVWSCFTGIFFNQFEIFKSVRRTNFSGEKLLSLQQINSYLCPIKAWASLWVKFSEWNVRQYAGMKYCAATS